MQWDEKLRGDRIQKGTANLCGDAYSLLNISRVAFGMEKPSFEIDLLSPIHQSTNIIILIRK